MNLNLDWSLKKRATERNKALRINKRTKGQMKLREGKSPLGKAWKIGGKKVRKGEERCPREGKVGSRSWLRGEQFQEDHPAYGCSQPGLPKWDHTPRSILNVPCWQNSEGEESGRESSLQIMKKIRFLRIRRHLDKSKEQRGLGLWHAERQRGGEQGEGLQTQHLHHKQLRVQVPL